MKIGMEATSATAAQKAGVGYYTENLIRALLELRTPAQQYTFYVRHTSPAFAALTELNAPPSPQVRAQALRFPLLWAQLRLPFELWRHRQDVYFFPSAVLPLLYLPERSVVTIHDIAFLFFPDCFSASLRWWLKRATETGIRRARKIIAVSETTRQDILAYYGVEPDKVVAIPHGVQARFRPLERGVVEEITRKYQIAGNYLLCVGTLQRRKNIPRLLQAFYLLKQRYQLPHKLVLIGQQYADLPEDQIFSTIARLFLQEEVIWPGYVAEADLPALINGAEIFVLPSLYEGFGMPLLEAMACGVPVACSNTSSLPEVVGESGALFDPYSVENIATTLYDLLTDEYLRLSLREKGLARAKEFSWRTCAQKTLAVLEAVAQS